MKKDHPILFSTPMVKAILSGRKTQTRRFKDLDLVNNSPDFDFQQMVVNSDGQLHAMFVDINPESATYKKGFPIKCPYGNVGDALWVRETWANLPMLHPVPHHKFFYKADGEVQMRGNERWKPSIHMPRVACRLFLEITSVRVEHLQDISEDDAKAEGVRFTDFGLNQYGQQHRGYHVLDVTNPDQCLLTARSAFGNLWEKINGEASWTANPWVWAVEFKQIKQAA